ncbi:molybdopterin molybdenumtransferase MoeA [Romboutsia weinsteinii]|uniref:Molybdopterin molybdenumtransferase n=1 Tax=Romboutsia weinsteinii TaxID=2020949 RepID=A0A371J130_9FIRM|nr:gephyrin-like molybdotransferase Glp [Romboutsia weinsteinii]RDY26387.1 molybdopterin molybdenumtransferase MoeA [Romboutsia weinsteinii]
MKSHISLQEAIEILNNNTHSLEVEEIDLIKGINRTIATNIYSTINNPPFNKSAMDGYAIIAKDTMDANIKFKVIDKIYAGQGSRKIVTNSTAIKIMTGSPIPNGANAVIKQEDVVIDGEYIKINKIIKSNENVCAEGEDIKIGDTLVKKNKKLNYADIGIIASSGINKIKVYKNPSLAFISTGDEVLDIDDNLTYGKIYNSNKYSILGRIQELGYEVNHVEHANDNSKSIGELIKSLAKDTDLIITTGGASVGEKDLIKEAIDSAGGEKLFWKVMIKPGSAVLCSKINNTIVISLSGNPAAALTTFELLVRTTLEKISGQENIEIKREKAILLGTLNKENPQTRFLRGKTVYEDGKQYAEITQIKSGNGMLSSTIDSNCLIEVEKGSKGVEEGSLINIIKF